MTDKISAADFQALLKGAGNNLKKIRLPEETEEVVVHSAEVQAQLAELDQLLLDAEAEVKVMKAVNNAIIRKQARFRLFGVPRRGRH
jgi:hypothetical protein